MGTKLGMLFKTEPINKKMFNALSKRELGGEIKFQTGGPGLRDVIPYASNLVNMFRTLPRVRKPELNTARLNPKMVNFNAEVNETDRLLRGIDKGNRTGNQTVMNALKANNIGKFLEQRNRLRMEEKNTNAQISNRAQEFNARIDAGNTDLMNEYAGARTERDVAGQRLSTENLANFSNKFQQQMRDDKLFDQEERRISMLPLLYQDTGVLNNSMTDAFNREATTFGGSTIERKPLDFGRMFSGLNKYRTINPVEGTPIASVKPTLSPDDDLAYQESLMEEFNKQKLGGYIKRRGILRGKEEPSPKKTTSSSATNIAPETRRELDNYSLSSRGRSLGYNTNSKLSDADEVIRAMDIVGNRFKMQDEFEAGDDKVTKAFKAVRKKEMGGHLKKKLIRKEMGGSTKLAKLLGYV